MAPNNRDVDCINNVVFGPQKVQYELDKSELTPDYSNEPDETIAERLMGLTEMIPPPVRNLVELANRVIVQVYESTANIVWAAFLSGILLAGPIMIEMKRESAQEDQRERDRREEMVNLRSTL